MASVIRLAPIGHGRRRGRWTDRYEHEYVQPYRATTDTATMDPYLVRVGAEALGLPQRGDAHPSDTSILVSEVEVEEQADCFRWIFNVKYSSSAADQTREAFSPLDVKPVATFAQEDWEEALQFDQGDNALVNSAGGFFDPPPTARRSRIVMTLVQNQPSYDPILAATYTNTLNETLFLGGDPKTVYCRSITTAGPRAFKNDTVAWPVSYVFVFADDPKWWQYRPLDIGKFYLKTILGVTLPQRFTDRFSRLLPDGLLDGSGGALPVGGTPVFLEFDLYEVQDFNALPLSLDIG